MIKHPNRLWALVLLLGWAFDFLFWEQYTGINFSIFITLCVLGSFYTQIVNDYRPAKNSLLLMLPVAFFSVISFVRQEPLTIFLAYMFTLFSVSVFSVTYRGGRWINYSLPDYFLKFFQLFISMVSRLFVFSIQNRGKQAEFGEAKKVFQIKPILRGLIIALPILVFFASQLASADVVFNQKLDDFIDKFTFEKIFEYVYRLFIILCWSIILAGIFLHTALDSTDEKLLGEDKAIIKPFLGFTEAITVLGSVIALFLLFVIIQFQYFFGGELNIGVEGYTYSQYARRGFSELVTVAVSSLLMILGLSTFTRRENENQKRIYSGLSVALVTLVLVILISAYQRLMLAIDWHGFSRLRLYPRVFLVWVGVLFVAVVIIEIFRRERYFTFAVLFASLGFAISLSLLNVDAAIVRHNVWRASQGKHINIYYLASLSTDAVPPLVDEFMNSSLSTSTRESVGAAILCYTHSLSKTPSDDWRYFTLSRWKADRALEEVQDLFGEYRLNNEIFPARVRTPGNEFYECPH